MDDVRNQQEARLRGEKARAIIESPLWTDAWAHLEEFVFEQFRKTAAQDKDQLAHLKRLHDMALKLRGYFETTVSNGAMAEKFLEHTEKQSRLQKFLSAVK